MFLCELAIFSVLGEYRSCHNICFYCKFISLLLTNCTVTLDVAIRLLVSGLIGT